MCGLLSKWWTQNLKEPREDIFWRTAGSGGRAKRRGRGGKDTANSHGDITAIDPVGEPLIDLLTIELKRGYSSFTFASLVDKPPSAAPSEYEKWILQADESHHQAASYSWLIILQRDRRLPLVIFPTYLHSDLLQYGLTERSPVPGARLLVELTDGKIIKCLSLQITTLDWFLEYVKPSYIKKLAQEC